MLLQNWLEEFISIKQKFLKGLLQNINEAIREKQLKKGTRKKKNDLINIENSEWKDLSEGWIFNIS